MNSSRHYLLRTQTFLFIYLKVLMKFANRLTLFPLFSLCLVTLYRLCYWSFTSSSKLFALVQRVLLLMYREISLRFISVRAKSTNENLRYLQLKRKIFLKCEIIEN
jgi:hypothetical protein